MTNQLSRKSSYIPALTFLRGLAALMVVGFHLFNRDFDDDSFLQSIFAHGHLGLDLFFLISGFVLPYAMYQHQYEVKQFFQFLWKRLARIEPPYIVSFLLILTMRYVHCRIIDYPFEMNWGQFFSHFLYLNQYFGFEGLSVVYWTLGIEFQFYILIGLIFPFLVHSNKLIGILTLALFSVFSLMVEGPAGWYVFQYGFLFMLGIISFRFYIKQLSIVEFALLYVLALVGIYITLGFEELLISVFGVVVILFLRREWKVTDFFGNISYSLYLTHSEVAGWFVLYTSSYFSSSLLNWILAACLCVAFAFVFHFIVEKPFLKLSKRIRY